ncbi:DeoR/GlpR family DNA-binding transcription regulator [Sphingobacterium sp. LRF_L2]|uniref:DeoR/GlpR family DNA-binding transcription regulator n=1 Tax=Sphingobacterium sp. LRF_L2 TaxID=3369421 RepID=UPI003F616298
MQNLSYSRLERHQVILAELRKKQKVEYSELSSLLAVSEDTIRRDVNELVEKGLLSKVKGGASVNTVLPISYEGRAKYATPEKEVVADKAQHVFESGMTVIFDGGTTPFMVAATLPHDIALTVFTHSFPVANLFLQAENIKTVFIGGTLSTNSQITTGIKVYEEYSKIQADICVLGVHSLDAHLGITDPITEESMVKKMICQVSDSVVAVATSDKLHRKSTYHVCSMADIGTLITELPPTDNLLHSFIAQGVTLF